MAEDLNLPAPSLPTAMARLRSSLDRIALPLATATIFALIICAYYFSYVRQRSQYLSERNFRALAMTGDQLSATIGNYGSILKEFGAEANATNKSPEVREKVDYLRYLAPNLGCFDTGPAADSSSAEPIVLKFWNGSWTLNVNVFDLPEPRKKPSTFYHACLDLKRLVDPLTVASPFKDILIASDDGSIVYQKTRAGPQFTTIEALLKNQPNFKETDAAGKAWKASPAAESVENKKQQAKLTRDRASGPRTAKTMDQQSREGDSPRKSTLVADDLSRSQAELVIAGVRYTAFFAPALLNLYSQTQRDENIARQWTICGLVRSDDFQWEAWAISYPEMIFAAALLIVITVSTPFLKLQFMNRRQRFKLRDIGYLLLFTIILCAVAVFALVQSTYFFHDRRDDTDTQLMVLGRKISQNLHTELSLIYEQTRSVCALPDVLAALNGSGPDREREVLKQKLSRGAIYPYFENIFWTVPQQQVRTRGQEIQMLKWSTRRYVTPMIRVDELPYFPRFRDKEFYFLHEAHPFRLDPVQSPNKDEYFAVFGMSMRDCAPEARLTGVPASASVFLVSRMLSLIDPVLPIGFGFALVDSSGNVLFHNDKLRNERENFLEESDHNGDLAAALYGRSNRNPFDIRYLGRDYRASVNPVEGVTGAPWVLITFRDQGHERTLDLETMAIGSIFYAIFLAVPVIAIGVVCLIAAPDYLPSWLVPRGASARIYVVHVLVLAATAVAMVVFWLMHGTEQLLLATFTLPYAALLAVSWVSIWPGSPSGVVSRRILSYGSLALVAAFGYLGFHYDSFRPLCAVAVVGAIFLVLRSSIHRLPNVVDQYYQAYYRTTLVLLAVVMGILPAFLCFQTALNLEYRLYAKQGQLFLASELEKREKRIAKDVESWDGLPLCTKTMAQRREESLLDNYSGTYFGTVVALRPHDALNPGDGKQMRSRGDLQTPTERYDEWLLRLLETVHRPLNAIASETLGVVRNRGAAKKGKTDRDLDEPPEWVWGAERLVLRFRKHGFPTALETVGGAERQPQDLLLTSVLMPRNQGQEAWRAGAIVIVITLLIAFPLIKVISRKIFLLDVQKPLPIPPGTILKRAIVILNSRTGWKAPPGTVVDLREERNGEKWGEMLVRMPSPSTMIITHLEDILPDAGDREQALLLLEHLTFRTTVSIIVAATVDPLFHIGRMPSNYKGDPESRRPEEFDRWARVFAEFYKTDAYITTTAPAGTSPLLNTECSARPELAALPRMANWPNPEDIGEGAFLNEVLDRARPVYEELWANSTSDERFVLWQLAQDGVPNPRNGAAIRQLLRKGLLVRDPEFRLMNKSFRLFVADVSFRELRQQWEEEARESGWGRLRGAFLTGLPLMAVFLLATQQDLWQSSIGIFTATFGAFGAVLKVVSSLRGRPGNEH